MENETNKSYRIRTNINNDSSVLVNFTQEYETFELLSIKMKTENLYRLHNANYGIIVGRVQANGGFGVPNAKISIFIEVDQDNENSELLAIYGYTDVFQTNSLGDTYNLLPDEQVSDCHKKIGAFPSKRYLLDNDTYIEIFDKYYKYTTRTNDAGDYILVGVPVGNQTLHMDLDLSDCGILSQRPRDFVYKGYNIEQFDNPNQFKSETGASINFLSQYVQQTKTVYVNPLWGNNELGETIGITRADVDVNFKFEPTCVFMGSLVSDSRSNGISMKCVPTDQMGVMDELTTGRGTIEMIRKTPTGDVEEFQIKGNELIDGNGTWCYQIPMNLDYVTTNEYGETVATDNPNIGIPTRARVRFRVSLDNFENSNDNYFAGKVLVPNNPNVIKENGENTLDYDYAFGTNTKEGSYRDLFWNNVYSVKQHIPRIQKSGSWRTDRFTGIKQCNFYGQNNPIPYNSIRIKLPFMFVVLCAIIKTYVRIVAFLNAIINALFQILTVFLYIILSVIIPLLPVICLIYWTLEAVNKIIDFFGGNTMDLTDLRALCYLDLENWGVTKQLEQTAYITIADGICPDLESWYFAPALLSKGMDYCFSTSVNILDYDHTFNICDQTITKIANDGDQYEDSTSTDNKNKDTSVEKICITRNLDYLMTCIEMNLAQEYKVIKFDFYNDWINGMLYIPRWKFKPEHKLTFLFGLIKFKIKTKGCFDDNSIFGRTRWLTQHCSLGYKETNFNGGYKGYSTIGTQYGCSDDKNRQKCHKNPGIRHTSVFGENGGIIHQEKTILGQTVYYYKPSEMSLNKDYSQTKINMFATDIILLGSLKDCDENGIPQSFKWLSGSSYKMPTNLALTNLDEAGVVFVDDGSYCRGGNNPDSMESKKIGIGDNSFSGQIQWSSEAPMEMQIMGYDGANGYSSPNSVEGIVKVASDRIALTEAAGISWDYTGPSQATPNEHDLFSPGGHFLGMSCINSKTNIKSCVNLQRICEAGTTMSERIEKTKGLKLDENGNYKQQSVVFSPNGLISTDEIIAGSFRNMFATMNLSPLIATKKDLNTGYLIYDFTYLRSNGFDGGAKKNIVSKSSHYNMGIADFIPDDFVYEEGSMSGADIDQDERDNTFHRSIEATNFGYYRFRFGLKDSDTNEFNKTAKSRYAIEKDGLKYLPQYENSFYFYFGLKDGNTAIDRLYSDFFSMCPNRQKEKKPSIKIKDSGIECCTREQSIIITCNDVEYPYDILMTDGVNTVTANSVTYKTVNICGLSQGEWSISVTDASGFSVIKKIKIGKNIRGIEYDFNDFKEKLDAYVLKDNTRLVSNIDYNKHPIGGELNFKYDDIIVFGKQINEFKKEYGIDDVGLLLVSSTDKLPSTSTNALMLKYNGNKNFAYNTFVQNNFYSSSVTKSGEQNRHKTDFEFGTTEIGSIKDGAIISKSDNIGVYLWGDKLYYTLYFIFRCGGDNLYSALSLYTFYSYGYESFNIFLGSKYLKYNGENSEGFSLSSFLNDSSALSTSTFDGILKKINRIPGEVTPWALRQALFDQRYDITVDSSDRVIRCTNLRGEFVDGILFGQPERAVPSNGGVEYKALDKITVNKLGGIMSPISSEAYVVFPGYEIDDTASLLPSITFDVYGTKKLHYYKMSYDRDYNSILSDPIGSVTIGSVTTDGKYFMILKSLSGINCLPGKNIYKGNAYILQSKKKKDIIIECSYVGDDEFAIPGGYWSSLDIELTSENSEFDILPTLLVPIIHRPFYFESYPFILGQFTAIGKSNLNINISEANTSTITANGSSVKKLTYGDRSLKYKLSRDSDKKNNVIVNDYIRIYGGNACAPDYLLGDDCYHFGEKIEEGISIAETLTGGTSDKVEKLYTLEQEHPVSIDIGFSTGIPNNTKLRTPLADKDIEELTAFVGGGDIKKLQSSTSYSIDNFLPKEIIIKKNIIKGDNDDDMSVIREERYLDVGGSEEYSAKEINKYVKLYMIIMPDNGKNALSSEMEKCIFDEKMFKDGPKDYYCIFNKLNGINDNYQYYTDTTKQTMMSLLSPITLSDYFSNPKAVAFLFDQIINSAHFSLLSGTKEDTDAKNGKIRGGYFNLPEDDGYITPGLIFGEAERKNIDGFNYLRIFSEISPILDSNFKPSNDCLDGTDGGVYSPVSGNGRKEYVDIATCLKSVKRGGNTLLDKLATYNLNKGLKNFGLDLDVVYKYNVTDEGNYPTADDVKESYCEQSTSEVCGNIEKFDSVFKLNGFDAIIGRNWSFPNIEYIVKKGNANISTCRSFSELIDNECKRVQAINESRLEDDEKEIPNYAKIIANYFIDNSYDVNTTESEKETLAKLFNGASTQYESFIVPIVLGKNTDDSGNVMSSFIWPGEADRYKISKDKTWISDKTTKFSLGHKNGERMQSSSIEDSIYAENLSYGFRSVVIGIYDGPENGDNSYRDTKSKTGNVIRPFKIYTYHHKGTGTGGSGDLSMTNNSHTKDNKFMPNEYYNSRTDSGRGKRKTENLHLYYYHTYENDYDKYASGWC